MTNALGELLRNHLRSELVRRNRANARYSLRAFARSIGVDPSTLSRILRAKRPITRKAAEALADRRGRFGDDVRALLDSFPGGDASPPVTDLSLDRIRMIADWYHPAIYELATIEGFRPEARWIARKLGISLAEARGAVDRLFRLGLLARDESGAWTQTAGLLSTTALPFTNVALRAWQHQALDLAKDAMERIPIGARDQSTLVFSADRAAIGALKERIRRFRRDLLRLSQRAPVKDAVYQLSVSLYPVTDRPRPARTATKLTTTKKKKKEIP